MEKEFNIKERLSEDFPHVYSEFKKYVENAEFGLMTQKPSVEYIGIMFEDLPLKILDYAFITFFIKECENKKFEEVKPTSKQFVNELIKMNERFKKLNE